MLFNHRPEIDTHIDAREIAMSRPFSLGLVLLLPLALGACGSFPTDGEGNPESVELGTKEPGSGFERLQRLTGYADGDCEGPQADDRLASARDDLRRRAAGSGADYVRVVGTGPLSERGRCSDEMYRISGVGYARASGNEASARSGDDSDTDKATQRTTTESSTPAPDQERSTADKLAELDELRERGLISESEYQRLRRKVLDEAF